MFQDNRKWHHERRQWGQCLRTITPEVLLRMGILTARGMFASTLAGSLQIDFSTAEDQRCSRQAFRAVYTQLPTLLGAHPLWILRRDYSNLKCRYGCWNTNSFEGHSALVKSVTHSRDRDGG